MAYTYMWGRPTETSDLYPMLTYNSWYIAVRKNVQFLPLGQFLSNNKEWRLHTWHTPTSGEDQQKPVNCI